MQGQKTEEVQDEGVRIIFDWNALIQFLFSSAEETKKIGHAWILFFDICLNVDRVGMYSATYKSLARRYQMAPITIKKWRQHLCQTSVIESFTRGHWIMFRLKGTYSSFLKPVNSKEKIGTNELLLQAVLKVMNDKENQKIC